MTENIIILKTEDFHLLPILNILDSLPIPGLTDCKVVQDPKISGSRYWNGTPSSDALNPRICIDLQSSC